MIRGHKSIRVEKLGKQDPEVFVRDDVFSSLPCLHHKRISSSLFPRFHVLGNAGWCGMPKVLMQWRGVCLRGERSRAEHSDRFFRVQF